MSDSRTNSPRVRYEIRNSAAWIVLDDPDRRNALSTEMIVALRAALHRAANESSTRAVVLIGEGSAFCAGADLKAGPEWSSSETTQETESQIEELQTDKRQIEEHQTELHPFAKLLDDIETHPLPIIAAVNGHAFGGGLGLIAAADIAIAVTGAKFSFSEVRLGLAPAMISVVVLPKIGLHHARRLFLTGRRFSSAEALSYGLVHTVAPAEEFAAAVESEIAEIALGGPLAVREAKRLIRTVPTLARDEAYRRTAGWIAELMSSEEAREGMAAFAEKRAARWIPQQPDEP